MTRGLSNAPHTEMIDALREELDEEGRDALFQMRQRIEGLTPQLRELLAGVLTLEPNQRWNIQDVRNSAWMQLAAAQLAAAMFEA